MRMGCGASWRRPTDAMPASSTPRRKRTGHFWQGRFGSVVMDEAHLAAAARYVSLNPVRARLVARAQDWRWSSVRANLDGRDDGLTEEGREDARLHWQAPEQGAGDGSMMARSSAAWLDQGSCGGRHASMHARGGPRPASFGARMLRNLR